MPAINRTIPLTPKAIQILSRHLSTTRTLYRDSQFRRSDFSSQGYSAPYEPNAPTRGPIAQASNHGAPRLTPMKLKEHLDKFVVGQDKAKKVTSVAVFNHYQRIRELRRLEAEEEERRAREERRLLPERERNSHPVENEYPGHVDTVDLNYKAPFSTPTPSPDPDLGSKPLSDLPPHTIIEKSNLLLLGPSGVGKTYIVETLARVLEVPYASVDCSSLTQAGYIGSDIEIAIERLLTKSDFSISRCETGIIFFDEVDKLAKPAVVTHGRDVSGEGVQQGLLKMIEGTNVTVSPKGDRSAKTEGQANRERGRDNGLGGNQPGGKAEQYTIDTSNILFVFAGAFVGLDRIVSKRLSSGSSIGFGAQLASLKPPNTSPKNQKSSRGKDKVPNPLKHINTSDLQTYGLIPELLGRIPILTTLSPLTLTQLVSILTEPKNSLVKQYINLLGTYGIQLKFSTGALHAIAERALSSSLSGSGDGKEKGMNGGGIGARGLRSIMEELLHEIQFSGPGSGIRYCLVDEAFVRGFGNEGSVGKDEDGDVDEKMPRVWSRGQGRVFEDAWGKEEESWKIKEDERLRRESGEEVVESPGSFEQYREVGSSGM